MICFIRNRPALQIGSQQVFDYDTNWLEIALERAVDAADVDDFPFVEDIRSGVVRYLETRCQLDLLPITDLYDRMRRMLVKIGCERIADHLRPLAPPVTVCLLRLARETGNGFEIGFFTNLRAELSKLRASGAEEIRFTNLRECAMELRNADLWTSACECLAGEIEAFLRSKDVAECVI